MVVASAAPMRTKKTKCVGVPTIDLSTSGPRLSQLMVKACEEYGFFKVINHGVSTEVVSRLEEECFAFFAKPAPEKLKAGPAVPFGYGFKNIGSNGDMGDLEYLLLPSNPVSLSETSAAISDEPSKFSGAVDDYVKAARELACRILDLVSEGLLINDKSVFSRLIRDVQSDSLLRINHYPTAMPDHQRQRIGFGEHSDPQILTVMRSNDVQGLEICLRNGLWVPVFPDPNAFYVMVGDAFQAMTNGRFKSVRHRAMGSWWKPRMSMVYFGAPPLNEWIKALPQMVSARGKAVYRPFTWGQYKKTTCSLRLGDSRLDLFKTNVTQEHNQNLVLLIKP